MARSRSSRSASPAAEQPPVSSAAVLVEYRFTVAHEHGGRSYRVGDIIECNQATADRIRRFAGEDALERVHGGAR